MGYLYQNTAALGFTTLPLLPLIRQRTLVLTGDEDPIIPVANGRILAAAIPHAAARQDGPARRTPGPPSRPRAAWHRCGPKTGAVQDEQPERPGQAGDPVLEFHRSRVAQQHSRSVAGRTEPLPSILENKCLKLVASF